MSLILKMQINDQSENKYIFSTENGEIELIPLSVISNGEYTPEEGTAFNKVTVSVPETVIEQMNITANGTYEASSGHAYDVVTVNVQPILDILVDTVNENGTYVYEPEEGYDGLEEVCVTVSVPQPNLERKSAYYDTNGNYTIQPSQGYDGISEVSVEVDVSGGSSDVITGTVTITDTTEGSNECWVPVTIPSGKTIAGILVRSRSSSVYTGPSNWHHSLIHWGAIPANTGTPQTASKNRYTAYLNSATATTATTSLTTSTFTISSTLGTTFSNVVAFNSEKGLGFKVKNTQGTTYGFAVDTYVSYVIILVDE